jgi:ribosome-binding protein aMBF1 (putative translation factor)
MKKVRTKDMIRFNDYLEEQLKDPEMRAAFDDLEIEYALYETIMRKRVQEGLTQKELAKRMGTKQTAISRFESGKYNPTLSFLKKLTKALGVKLEVKII